MDTQGRDGVSSASHSSQHLTLTLVTQCGGMLLEESLHRRMLCAAACRELTGVTPAVGPPPMTAAEQAQISESAVPILRTLQVLESPPMAAAEQAQLSEYEVPTSGTPQVLHLP